MQAKQATTAARVEWERIVRDARAELEGVQDTCTRLQGVVDRQTEQAAASRTELEAVKAALAAAMEAKEGFEERCKSLAETQTRQQQQMDAFRVSAEQARADAGAMISQLNTDIELLKQLQLDTV